MRALVIAHDIEQGGAFKSLLNNIFELSLINGLELIVCTVHKGAINKYCDKLKIENYVTKHGAFMIGGGSTKFRHLIRIITKPYLKINYMRMNHNAQKRISKYIDLKNINVIYSNLNRNDIGAILAKKYNIPHVWHIREYGELDFGCISLRKNYIEYMKQGANYFIANSISVANYWINKGLPKEKVLSIYNGIDMMPGSKHWI